MPNGGRRQYPELPDHEDNQDAALGFIADGGTYAPTGIRETNADVYAISPEHRALRLKGGALALHNYGAQVLRKFTCEKFHIRHGHADNVTYYITAAGIAAGRSIIGRRWTPQS